jgi:hypothetical protein
VPVSPLAAVIVVPVVPVVVPDTPVDTPVVGPVVVPVVLPVVVVPGVVVVPVAGGITTTVLLAVGPTPAPHTGVAAVFVISTSVTIRRRPAGTVKALAPAVPGSTVRVIDTICSIVGSGVTGVPVGEVVGVVGVVVGVGVVVVVGPTIVVGVAAAVDVPVVPVDVVGVRTEPFTASPGSPPISTLWPAATPTRDSTTAATIRIGL